MAANEILRTSATGWATAANWVRLDGTTAGTDIDSTNDTRVINAFDGSITANLSPTFGGAGGMVRVTVNPACTGNIGTGAGSIVAPMDTAAYSLVTTSAAFIYKASGGSLYLSGDGDGVADTIHIYIQNSGGRAYLTGTWTSRHVFLEAGSLQIVGTVTGVSTYAWYWCGGTADLLDSSTELYDHYITGGTHVLRRGNQGVLYIGGGDVIIDAGDRAFAAIVLLGGRVTLRNSGTITDLKALGGIWDESQTQRPIAITTQNDGFGCTFISSPNVTRGTRNKWGTGAKGLT